MPQQFGRFWLHEKIGHGGMAEIFRSSIGPDPQSAAFDIAIKRLQARHNTDRSHVDAFLTEADVTKFLRHPNLVQVYESGFADELPYIAMEYVWGLDLGRLMTLLRQRRMRFPADLAVFVAMRVLRGIDYIHRASTPGGESMEMIHRDITPENIYLTFGGEAKIGDFGIAHVSFITSHEADVVVGKPSYLPPEVLTGAPISQRDDLWAMAVCLYEMLTAKPIYGDIDDSELIAGVVKPTIAPIHESNPDVDDQLAQILALALHRKPKRRPQDAATFYKVLKGYLRSQGIELGPEALARFVRSATGASTGPAESRGAPRNEEFEGGAEYHFPEGPSLTQRFQIVTRQRRRLWGPLLLVAAAVGVAVAVLLLR